MAAGVGWDVEQNDADLSTWIDGGLKWWYEWKLEPTFKNVDIEFVPQAWGPDDAPKVKDFMGTWPEGTEHVFSFNERGSNNAFRAVACLCQLTIQPISRMGSLGSSSEMSDTRPNSTTRSRRLWGTSTS